MGSRMDSLMTVKDLVHMILDTDKRARDDDRWLVLKFYSIKYPSIPNMAYKDVMAMEGIESAETITRCRRKVQEEYPALRPSTKVQKEKREQVDLFREFARGV